MQGSHRRQRREWRDEKQASDERSRQEAWQGGKGITFQQRAAEDLTLSYWGVVSRSRVFFLFFCFFFFCHIFSVKKSYLAHSRCLVWSECLCLPRNHMWKSCLPKVFGGGRLAGD